MSGMYLPRDRPQSGDGASYRTMPIVGDINDGDESIRPDDVDEHRRIE